MKYYKGYLDKEWVRKQLRKKEIELKDTQLTNFLNEVEDEVMKENQIEDTIKSVVKRFSEKQKRITEENVEDNPQQK